MPPKALIGYSQEQVDAYVRATGHPPLWADKGNTQVQLRLPDAVVNYYTGAGKVLFQGKNAGSHAEQFIAFHKSSSSTDAPSASPATSDVPSRTNSIPIGNSSGPSGNRAASSGPSGPSGGKFAGGNIFAGKVKSNATVGEVSSSSTIPNSGDSLPLSSSSHNGNNMKSVIPGIPNNVIPTTSIENKIMTLGKHSGKSFAEIVRKDGSYITWAASQDAKGPLQDLVNFNNAVKSNPAYLQLPATAPKKRTREEFESSGSSSCAAASLSSGAASSGGDSPGNDAKRQRKEATGNFIRTIDTYDLYIYFDGSCHDNKTASKSNAGWGCAVFHNSDGIRDLSDQSRRQIVNRAKVELCGRVEKDSSSVWHIGGDVGTNNTGELSGIAESLLFVLSFGQEFIAKDQQTNNQGMHLGQSLKGLRVLLLFDSFYAARCCIGENRIQKNPVLGNFTKWLLHRVRGMGAIVEMEHVKGHTGDLGNEKADHLANTGLRLTVPKASPQCYSRCLSGQFQKNQLFKEFQADECRVKQFYCTCNKPCQGSGDKVSCVSCGFSSWK